MKIVKNIFTFFADDQILVANLHRSVHYGNVNAVRKFISSRYV